MSVVKSQIQRCIEMIERLSDHSGALALGELASALDLPKSATHRLLQQLVELGWVVQDDATGGYALTMRLTMLGQRRLHRSGLPDIYQPMLEDLARRTQSFARIAVVEGRSLTWVGHAQGCRSGLIYQPEEGSEIRLNVTANGKAWLASLSSDEAMALLLRQGIGTPASYGPKAKTRLEDILGELELTRMRGWAIADEEGEAGVVAIAAAIVADGDPSIVLGTVSIAGPTARLGPQRHAALAVEVQATAADLGALWPIRKHAGQSRALGASG